MDIHIHAIMVPEDELIRMRLRAEAAEARVTVLEAALRDLIPWAGRQTFVNDVAWVNARAALAAPTKDR